MTTKLKGTAGKLLAIAAALVTTASAYAGPIRGSITLNGSFTPDARTFQSMTRFMSLSGVGITGGTLDYAGIVPVTPVAVQGFNFTSLNSPVTQWLFSDGARQYSFLLTSVNLNSHNVFQAEMEGAGVLFISGYDPTPATWRLTAINSRTRRFSAEFTALDVNVPDGGGAALLLVMGCAGILGVHRICRNKIA